MNQTTTREVTEFVDAVDTALADLPAEVRTELLEDLPDHLADVLADGGTPQERLGEPAAYAAELRAAAGLSAVPSTSRHRIDVAARLRAVDIRMGAAIGYARVSDFARALLPAWWILRAYLTVQLLSGAHSRTGAGAVVPRLGDNEIVGVIALVAACAVSIWLGRHSTGRWAFAASVVVAVALVGYSTLLVQDAVRDNTVYVGDEGYGGPLTDVTNIFPVGPDGKQLSGVRLYDQDGTPISIGDYCANGAARSPIDPSTGETLSLYPIVCPDDSSPFVAGASPSPLPSVLPSPSSVPVTTPRVTPSASPTR